jgi:Uma2 family endonuclease
MRMATSTIVPLEEYLHTSYEPECEWINGTLKEKSMPDGYHAYFQGLLLTFFYTRRAVFGMRALSPDDRRSDLMEKIEDYVQMGVPAIWVVDPRKRTLAMADADGIHQVEELTLQGTNVKLTAAEIFAELDQLESL